MKRIGVFDVDTDGMRTIALRRGVAPLLFELIQNAFDEGGVTHVSVTLEPVPDRAARWRLVVEDNAPNGFANLADAWTLYGDSYKRTDPTKRGFMDIGEKFVIAVCEWAAISTTTGCVVFDDQGRRQIHGGGTLFEDIMLGARSSGTRFEGIMRITKPQALEALAELYKLIPPDDIETTVNGTPLLHRTPLAVVPASLQTTVKNDEGLMEKRTRKTMVRIYEPLPGEHPTLYEMGLPVVETDDLYHVNVLQRVPLNSERDNVPPYFLRVIRVLVLDARANMLGKEQAAATWVREAVADERTTPEVINTVMTARFGERRVAFDMHDREANAIATRAGYTVVHGASLSKDEWTQVRRAEALLPAGQVTPSPKVEYSASPEAAPERHVPPEKWTPGMHAIAEMARYIGHALLGVEVRVWMINEPIARNQMLAWYGSRTLSFNVGRLGYRWFDKPADDPVVLSLVLHELAHEVEANHLSDQYTHAVCDLAGKAVAMALRGTFVVPPALDAASVLVVAGMA